MQRVPLKIFHAIVLESIVVSKSVWNKPYSAEWVGASDGDHRSTLGECTSEILKWSLFFLIKNYIILFK